MKYHIQVKFYKEWRRVASFEDESDRDDFFDFLTEFHRNKEFIQEDTE